MTERIGANMKRIVVRQRPPALLWAVLAVSLVGPAGWVSAAEVIFHVATNGDDSWHGTRATPNARRTDGPFATVVRARDAIRPLIARRLVANVRVMIHAGVYRTEKGLHLGPRDSGTIRHAITYAAAPGETVTLTGGVRLTGWSADRNAIVRAALPEGIDPRVLIEGETRGEPARVPESGDFTAEGPVPGDEDRSFTFRAGDFDPAALDLTGATVRIWTDGASTSESAVARLDPDARSVTLAEPLAKPVRPGTRYQFLNGSAGLRSAGRWRIDRARNSVLYWPRRSPVGADVVVTTADGLIALEGGDTPDSLIRNVHFVGLNLNGSQGDVVSLRNVEGVSVRACLIENGGRHGVLLHKHAQRVTVSGNLIRYHGDQGVRLQGLPPGQADVNRGNEVTNNHIHHCGRSQGGGSGVVIDQSGSNRVEHNEIHHTPRYGTSIQGFILSYLRKAVPGATDETRYAYLHSRSNSLSYNNIDEVNEDSLDTGGMESWGPGRDNVYDHNVIHDLGNSRLPMQFGIYLDDASSYFKVTNNVVYGVRGAPNHSAGPVLTKGRGNVLDNNIFVVGPGNNGGIESGVEPSVAEVLDRHVYTHNIIVYEKPRRLAPVYRFLNWNDERVETADRNLFWAGGGRVTFTVGPRSGEPARAVLSELDLRQWRAALGKNYDRRSVVADPRFVDPARRNYRLRPTSPALALGFKDIDVSGVGLTGDFPARLRHE